MYEQYNSSYINDWLNLNSTKTLFNVPTWVQFAYNSHEASNYLINEIQDSIKYQFPNILSQIKVLLYNGQDDLIVSTPGAIAWINSIPWRGQGSFTSAKPIPWTVYGEVAGYAKSYFALMTVAVNKAGHLPQMDQIAYTLDMVNRFVYNLGTN